MAGRDDSMRDTTDGAVVVGTVVGMVTLKHGESARSDSVRTVTEEAVIASTEGEASVGDESSNMASNNMKMPFELRG